MARLWPGLEEGKGLEVKFLIAPGLSGGPSWWLYGADGEVLAWAGQYFASLAYAQQAALMFKSAASRATYEIYPDGDGRWKWRALEYLNYSIACSPESFVKEAQARRAARNAAKSASSATCTEVRDSQAAPDAMTGQETSPVT